MLDLLDLLDVKVGSSVSCVPWKMPGVGMAVRARIDGDGWVWPVKL